MIAKRATLSAAWLTLALVGLVPLCFMIYSSFRADGGFSLRNYVDVLGNARTWGLFGNSLLLSALTTAAAGLIGVPLGLLIARTDLPLRYVWAAIFALPLLFPPYILAIGWFEILGRQGVLSRWVGGGVIAKASAWLFGLPGVVLVLASAFLPIVLVLTITYLRGMNPGLEEAARLTCGWPRVIGRITLPLIAPGILLALLLVFLLTMAEFGAPAFLRLAVFPVASFTQSSAFYNFGRATAAAAPLILVVLLGVLGVERSLHEKEHYFRWAGWDDFAWLGLGRYKYPVLCVVVTLATMLVGAPLAGVLWRGCSPNALTDAIQRAGDSVVRSIFYAGVSATILSVLGFFLAYLIHRRTFGGWRSADVLALLLFTLPGTVLGTGLIALWNRSATNWIYATPMIVVVGFVAQYAALTIRIAAAGFAQIPSSLEEAAQVAGASWFRCVFRILMPPMRPTLLASWSIAFIFCARDVALPLLLAPPGGDTLTARTMTLMANGSPELIAALCVLAILVAFLPLSILGIAWRGWSRSA